MTWQLAVMVAAIGGVTGVAGFLLCCIGTNWWDERKSRTWRGR